MHPLQPESPTQQDLRHEVEYLRERLASAEAEARARDALLAHLGHELRTPLGPIANLIAVLKQRRDLPEDVGPMIEMMERNLWREVRIVDELVDTMRVARGRLELRCRPIELDAVLGETVTRLADDLREADVQLVLSPDAPGACIDGDEERLQQLFRILLVEALEAALPRGEINVQSSDSSGQDLAVTIEGVRPANRATTALEQPSPGAVAGGRDNPQPGLPIARAIAEAHGGTLARAAAGAGGGIRYVLILPRLKATD